MTEIVLWVSVQELCQCGGFTEQIIVEAVDHGIAQPADGDNIADWMFDATTAHWLRKAVRLIRSDILRLYESALKVKLLLGSCSPFNRLVALA